MENSFTNCFLQRGKVGVKIKAGAKGEAKVFAGLKEGVDLAGSFQWLNPEGLTDANSPKRVKPENAIAEFGDFAQVSAGASFIQGLAVEAGFECVFIGGRFRIAAKVGACFGMGAGAKLGGEVGFGEIGEFVMFMSHQFKQADYKKMAVILAEEHFKVLNQMLFVVEATGSKLSDFVDISELIIETRLEKARSSIEQNGKEFLWQLQQRFEKKWGWFAYMPPEARSSMIAAITGIGNDPRYADQPEIKNMAAFCTNELLATCQSTRHLDCTLERVALGIMDKGNVANSVQQINKVTAGTQFDNALQIAQNNLANMSPLYHQPFVRNDDGFNIAYLPLNGATYQA